MDFANFNLDLKDRTRARVFSGAESTHASKPKTMAACTQVTATKAHVHTEFGLYIFDLV